MKARVIGGGPAGCAAAIRLARSGVQVRLYEKNHFPRPKLCGGFLSFEALDDLEDFNCLEPLRRAGAVALHRTVIASRRGTVIESPLPGEALSISRATLDHLLLMEARASGVEVFEGIDGFSQPDASDVTIIAAGRLYSSSPSQRAGWSVGSRCCFGVQALFENMTDVTDQVELDLIEDGYVGVARQADGVNVCALTTQATVQRWGPNLDRVLAHFAAQNPVLSRHLRAARRITPWMATGPVQLGVRQLAEDRTFYVGDAACVVDPFAGEGMACALYSARLLSEALRQMHCDAADEYRRLWKAAFLPSLRWQAVARMLYSIGFFREASLRLLPGLPGVLSGLMNLTRYRQLESL